MNFFDKTGLNVTEFKKEGVLFPVHMFHVEVLQAIRAGEEFDLAIRPYEFGNGFMEFLHLALKNGKVVAFGKVRHFAVNAENFKVYFNVPDIIKEKMTNILYKFEMLKPGEENANTTAN
jgi:acyl-CoA thioesterase FadM